jgi:hypothetical protein
VSTGTQAAAEPAAPVSAFWDKPRLVGRSPLQALSADTYTTTADATKRPRRTQLVIDISPAKPRYIRATVFALFVGLPITSVADNAQDRQAVR